LERNYKEMAAEKVAFREKNEELISSFLQRVEQSLKFKTWKSDQ